MEHAAASRFTEGSILRPLVKFTLPIMLASLLQSLYGAVDLMIVGQFSPDAGSVSAVATGGSMMNLPMMLIIGLTMGATVRIGNYIGEERPEKAGEVVGTSIALFGLIAVVMTGLMFLLSHPFARLMNVPEEAFDYAIQYVSICSGGLVFIIAYNVISSIFRGLGNSKLPLLFVAISCVVNIFGDLLLVAVFHMGAAGAAYATVFAQAVSVVLSLVIIRRTPLPFTFKKSHVRFCAEHVKSIFKLGTPIALQDVLTSVSFLVVNAVINDMGVVVSAGYGVSQKVVSFILLIPSSFGAAMSAFVAQNVGARKLHRAQKVMFYGMGVALCVGVVMFALSFFFGDRLSAIFTPDPAICAVAGEYLKGFSFDCLMTAILFCAMGYFNGCGRTMFVMAQGLVGALCVRMPFAIWMSRRPDPTLFSIGLATPLASLVSILLCAVYYYCAAWNKTARHSIQ